MEFSDLFYVQIKRAFLKKVCFVVAMTALKGKN